MSLGGKRNKVRSSWWSSVETASNWLRTIKSGSNDETETRCEPATDVRASNQQVRQVKGKSF
jgi:hypothetical protein